MSSQRENVLAALFAGINARVLGTARRDEGNATAVPGVGALVTQEDGSLDAEAIMSPLQYAITHSVPITVQAAGRPAMDAALLGIAGFINEDPTLGGLVDWAEVSGPDAQADAPTSGQQQLPREQVANVTVTLSYLAPTPAG